MNILISILGGVVAGLVIGFFLWGKRDSSLAAQNDGRGLIAENQVEKAANLEKVRVMIQNQEKITNEDVRELLKVLQATAVRYLDELESAGIIKQVGLTGQGVYYIQVK